MILCDNCGGSSLERFQGYGTLSILIGDVYFKEVTRIQCKDCDDVLIDSENWRLIDTLLAEREAVAIGKLAISKFVSAPDAAEMLGTTRQALNQNRGIATGKIISIRRGRHIEYYKPSIERYIDSGEGRFFIGDSKKILWGGSATPTVLRYADNFGNGKVNQVVTSGS